MGACTKRAACLVAGLALWSAAPARAFDRVLLKDGRVIEGTILETENPDKTVLDINGFEIPIGNEMIQQTYVENLENYVPKDKKEESYLKKGWVLFEGRWMSGSRREKELRKRATADKKIIEETRRRQQWRSAQKIDTPVFTIRSNMDPEPLDVWVTALDAYYRYFKDFWGIKRKTGFSKSKMRVFLYRTPEDFHKITETPGNVGGFFNWFEGELHIPYDREDPSRATAVLFHEFNHLLTHLIEPGFNYPIWLNEGMAEYYGTAQVDEDERFQVGRQQDGRIVNLMRDKDRDEFLRLKDVLLTDREGFGAREYAYAWSFVHFLMESEKYSRRFVGFFGNLPNNRDVPYVNEIISRGKPALKTVQLADVLNALEKRLERDVEQLEAEWIDFIEQAYGELSPMAYYRAARIEYMFPKDDDSHVHNAVEFYEKAIELGIQYAPCYRGFAELLRKGGILEFSSVSIPLRPNPVRAWDMIQRAIELDPVAPTLYCEAAGILMMDSAIQDLDRAANLAETAKALGPRSWQVAALYDELMAMLEPAREARRKSAEARASAAADDARTWMVFPFYVTDVDPVPERIENLTTDDLRELILSGVVTGRDRVFQNYQYYDEASERWVQGEHPWDSGWVDLKDVPDFAADLEAAQKG